MSLHRLTKIAIGVPDVDETAKYYTEFGLTPTASGFATADGGEQLELRQTPHRRLLTLGIGADDPDDLGRITASLARLGVESRIEGDALYTKDPVTGLDVVVSVAPRLTQDPPETAVYNQPGSVQRANLRAPGIDREQPVRPRKLGHVVFGSTDQAATQRFFTEGLGFKVSDEAPGLASFMRCSTDHHNVLVQQAPVSFLHHTSWEVDDVDEVGRGATAMLEGHPERHTWGLGRHYIGSNFFWYLRDPAGNFSEYYSDIDCILEDQLWEPRVIAGEKSLYAWGPPPPPSFLAPQDLAELMTDAHDGA
ncbi:VOC family protein [Amycolatopsis echigonensis]|uniref:Catechol-2,3-dioxygenase n=1 Tax=Amycolatopsis echigonensis TaxID=2576905 RepID=A0A2N3WS41_9PSEU|nr:MULTISPECIES: VOC family protein [Amycolatopsis]MBB2505288.1 VOC family protein [Amycolatopsis echigonensis]PKV96692.1 catechol-2,3-dioxygenase [Amycolatopsis niigatensis]